MLRLMGMFLVLGGSVGLGVAWQKQYVKRIEEMKSLFLMLQSFQGEIQYGLGTIPECCLAVSRRVPEPFCEMLRRIAEQMHREGGEALENIVTQNLERILLGTSLKREDLETAFGFIFRGGNPDKEQQLLGILAGKQELEERIGKLEKEKENRCRVSVALGTLGGMLLLVVLL